MVEVPFAILALFVITALTLAVVGIVRRGSIFMFIAGGLFFVLFINMDSVSGDNITGNTTSYLITNRTDYYNVNTGSTTTSSFSATGINVQGEFLSTTNSTLVEKEVNQITFRFTRTGVLTGNLYAGVWNGVDNPRLGNAKFIFGQITANGTSSTVQNYVFTRNDTKTYVLQTVDVIGILSTNTGTLTTVVDTTNPYDSTTTYRRQFSNATKLWTDSTTQDLRMKVSLVQIDNYQQSEPANIGFNDEGYRMKLYFLVLSACMMFIGALFFRANEQ